MNRKLDVETFNSRNDLLDRLVSLYSDRAASPPQPAELYNSLKLNKQTLSFPQPEFEAEIQILLSVFGQELGCKLEHK